MADHIEIKVRLFGAFRRYSSASEISLKIASGSSVAEVKTLLAQHLKQLDSGFSEQTLMENSVLADETRILSGTETIQRSARLAILPPVCGG